MQYDKKTPCRGKHGSVHGYREFAERYRPETSASRDARFVPLDSCLDKGCEGEEHMSVLDVAVGHGMYGIQCARQHPGLSVTALGSLPLLQKVSRILVPKE